MPVRIEVLRAFRILGPDGNECLVPSGKRTRLLHYLVIKKNGAPRDELAAALWPSAPSASARQSLRQAISSLRGLLGVDVFAGRDRIRLDESTCTVDSWEFQERFSMSDHRGCLDLVSGALEANLPTSASPTFVRIWETWHETILRHIHVSVLAEARRALEAGDPEAAELAIGQGSLELVMVDPESGSETLLTNNDWNDYGLHISETRGHICWQAEEFGHYEQDILAMDLETQIEVLAARGSGRQERCRFSLDGSFLTYISGESGDEELMLRFLDGGFEHRVTAFSGTEYVVGTVPIR